MRRSYRAITLAMLVAVVGCAPSTSAPGGQPSGGGATTPAQRKSIEIILRAEPNAFVTAQGLVGQNARPSRYFHEFLNSYIAVRDGDDEIAPHLAVSLPSLDDGTWKVLPDGRMEATWKLRPGITWHDGKSLTSDDVKFAWEVALDPLTLFGASTIARYLDRIDTPDPSTFTMHWKETNQLGNELGERQFEVLPRHILEEPYRADPAGIPNHPFMTTPEAFISSGPYRPVEWERGSHITVEAWDAYFLGRPKIDRITFRVIQDSRTALSNLLSDASDASYLGLEYTEARILEREWAGSGKGIVQFAPSSSQMILPQFKPELTTPTDLLNLNVRKGLMHAMNRQDLTDALDLGPEMVADSTTFPGTAIGDAVARVVARYPYDPARSAALLAENGWQRGPDGILTRGGRPFEVEFRSQPSSATAVVYPILEQQFRRAGIILTLKHHLPSNLEDQVLYPGLLSSGLTVNNLIFAQRWHTRFTAGPQTRYSGENRQGYSEPATDAAIDRLLMSVRRDEQLRNWGEAWRRITEDVAIMPTYYDVSSYVARKGVTGMQPKHPLGAAAYQVHMWEAS